MAAVLILLLFASIASGSYIRYPRDTSGSGSGSGAFSGSGASSSSYSSSSGTNVNPGPGGYGNFNAFAGSSNYPPPSFPAFGSDNQLYRGGEVGSGVQFSQSSGGGSQFGQRPFGFPGFTPYVPQYGQPFTPFPTFAAPFDFMSFLNQYFQSLQNFQSQADVQAQQAAASGGGGVIDTNEVGGVGGVSMATYGPQGGYGSANVFPKVEGGLESRFGGDNESPQNSLSPVGSVSGSFKPPGGSSYGVFTSSSSGSSDINGKKTSFKQSSIGINDNGKVTTYTAHDP